MTPPTDAPQGIAPLPWTLRLLARLLPRAARDGVLGDVLESQAAGSLRGAPWRVLLGIAWHHHLACYAERDAALALLRLHAVALAGVLVLPLAGATVLAGVVVFDGTLRSATQAVWSGAPALAALAAGVWLGRASLPGAHLDIARLHTAPLLLGLGVAAAPSTGLALVAAALLLAGAALGAAGRRADEVDAPITPDPDAG